MTTLTALTASISHPSTYLQLPSTSQSPCNVVFFTQSMFHAVMCDAKYNWYQCLLRCYVMSVTRFHHFIIFVTRIYRGRLEASGGFR